MKITIRTRPTKDGCRSIYLDCYERGRRRFESLNLYLVPESSYDARRLNEAAIAKANEMKSRRMLGIEDDEEIQAQQAPLPRTVFAEWLDKYVERVRHSSAYAEGTKVRYKWTADILREYLRYRRSPRLQMSGIDKDFVLGFIDYLRNTHMNTNSPGNPRRLSANTIRFHQVVFSQILKSAVREGIMEANPFASLSRQERVSRPSTQRAYLTREEVMAFAAAPTGNETTKRAFLFCCFTGLRYSDVSRLLWRDIRQEDSGLLISLTMQKTGKQVRIPLNNTAMQYLPDRKGCKPTQRVFDMTGSDACNICLKKIAKAANIKKNISFHTSRHTFAVMTLAAGGDIYTVSKLMGHTNISTTQIYADTIMETKVDAVNKITEYFRK